MAVMRKNVDSEALRQMFEDTGVAEARDQVKEMRLGMEKLEKIIIKKVVGKEDEDSVYRAFKRVEESLKAKELIKDGSIN